MGKLRSLPTPPKCAIYEEKIEKEEWEETRFFGVLSMILQYILLIFWNLLIKFFGGKAELTFLIFFSIL